MLEPVWWRHRAFLSTTVPAALTGLWNSASIDYECPSQGEVEKRGRILESSDGVDGAIVLWKTHTNLETPHAWTVACRLFGAPCASLVNGHSFLISVLRLEWRGNFAQTFRWDSRSICVAGLGLVQALLFSAHRTISIIISEEDKNRITMINTMMVVAFAGFLSAGRTSHFNSGSATVGDGA